MEEREFEASVYEYLVFDKAYPKAEIQVEAALGTGTESRYRADLAVLDSKRSEVIALVEVKRSREHKALRSAISQLLQYRQVLGKPYVPLYLFFPPIPGSGSRFEIAQVLPDGETRTIYPSEFPSYEALVSGDKSSKKATRTAAVRATVDTFQVTCICLSIAVALVLGFDISGLVQLSAKQLALAGISGALLILPFAAKFKMLGVEFERHIPSQPPGNES
ncbi:type I restriction enzyme HsdR N-terminal domain-containing protein [Thermomonas sp.]|jgi:hypothetical protein|uniref:type I restriction enzyme HsdR N-terminal domain-containing protein n=1 Tax=Thermomonas sp. TaxID=1971895 RepID=UPI00257AE3CA|nr:type I restriction enzyme HsdR N-terminal domain-containing protein [Thermomonas sp.]